MLEEAWKNGTIRNIPFLRPNQQKPRHGQTDGRQEINRSAASGDGRGAWGYDEGRKR